MPRIKIEDLPQDMKISKEEMIKVLGGTGYNYITKDFDPSAYGYEGSEIGGSGYFGKIISMDRNFTTYG
jgi:hypothetical protein